MLPSLTQVTCHIRFFYGLFIEFFCLKMYFLSDGGPQLSRQNKIHLQQNKINSRQNKENELVSGWSAVGQRLVSDWSAVVIGI